MSLNAQAKAWAPPGADPTPLPVAPEVQWPPCLRATIACHESGSRSALRPQASSASVPSLPAALQLLSTLAPGARSDAAAYPSFAQGFAVVASGSPCDTLEAQPGLLLAVQEKHIDREWRLLAELFKGIVVDGDLTDSESKEPLGARAIGFLTMKRAEFLFLILDKETSAKQLQRVSDRVRSTFQVQRVSPIHRLLESVAPTVTSPIAHALVLTNGNGVSAQQHEYLKSALPDGNDGFAAVHKFVELCPPQDGSVLRCVERVLDAMPNVQAGRSKLCVWEVAVAEDEALIVDCSAEALRRHIALLREFAVFPVCCFDARMDTALPLCRGDACVRLDASFDPSSTLRARLWPVANSPLPTPISTVPTKPTFVPVHSAIDAERILTAVRAVVPNRSSSRSRLSRQDVAALLPKAADGSLRVRRHVYGTPVWLVFLPNILPTVHARDPIPARLYCCDPALSTVAVVPPTVRTLSGSFPSGPSVLQAVWSQSHLGSDFTKLVVTDVAVWGGVDVTDESLDERQAKISSCVESDACYNFRGTAPTSLIRAEFVDASQALERLLSPKATQADFDHCGIVVAQRGPWGTPSFIWEPTEATVATFAVGCVTTRADGGGLEPLRRCELMVSETNKNVPYCREHCDVAPETLPRTPVRGDVLQALCRVESDGSHWWEPLRLATAREALAMTHTRFTPVGEESASKGPWSVATKDGVDALISQALLAQGDINFLLRAADYVCSSCEAISDRGAALEHSGATSYVCDKCLPDHGRVLCPACGSVVDATKPCPICATPVLEGANHLTERELRSVLVATVAGRDEQLRLCANGTKASNDVSSTTLNDTPPPPYVAAAANIPATLSLQWPLAASCCMSLSKALVGARLSRVRGRTTVVDLCCGADALIEPWVRDANCFGYVGVDECVVTCQLVEGRAALLRGPPRVSTRDEVALRPQPIRHTVVNADAFAETFWTQQLRRSLPPGVDRPSLVTCFRVMPLHRQLSQHGATSFFEGVAKAIVAGGAIVVAVLDLEKLVAECAADAELSATWSDTAKSTAVVTFKRVSGGIGSNSNRSVSIPRVNPADVVDAATTAGFSPILCDEVPSNVLAGAQEALSPTVDVEQIPAGTPGSMAAEEGSWTAPVVNGSSALRPLLTKETALIMRCMAILGFRFGHE